MAYVVARRNGRFEVRESLHTPKGPRAHTLAGFDVLTDEVLFRAAARATRPFDAQAVRASGRRAGAPVAAATDGGRPSGVGEASGGWEATGVAAEIGRSRGRFVESSQRMARVLGRPRAASQADPGAVLVDLLGFADAVARGLPARPFAPLTFPALARLVEDRRETAGSRRR